MAELSAHTQALASCVHHGCTVTDSTISELGARRDLWRMARAASHSRPVRREEPRRAATERHPAHTMQSLARHPRDALALLAHRRSRPVDEATAHYWPTAYRSTTSRRDRRLSRRLRLTYLRAAPQSTRDASTALCRAASTAYAVRSTLATAAAATSAPSTASASAASLRLGARRL